MNASLDNMQPIASAFTKTVSSTAIPLTDAAIGFTAKQVANARRVHISVEGNPIRYATIGTPTANNGHPVAVGDSGYIDGKKAIQTLKLIRSTGSDATVQITLYK